MQYYFSGLYKKICDKAEEIQNLWRDKIQNFDEFCEKDDHADGYADEVHLETMTPEEKEELLENNVWLPLNHQIEKRIFGMNGALDTIGVNKAYSNYKTDYYENEKRIREMEEHFKREEIVHVLALMFVMERYYIKQWNFDKQEWEKIQK